MSIRMVAAVCCVLLPSVAWCQGPSGSGIRLREVRTYSGEGNSSYGWGSVGRPLLRNSYADYPDGIGEVFRDGANPRAVSNRVVDQLGQSIPNRRGMSDFVWAWGQFLDHDLDLTDSQPANGACDIPVLDPADLLYPTIFMNRSNFVVADGVRAQINEITAFIDGSQVYGSDASRARALRTLQGGRLKTSPGNLLPFNVDGLPNLGTGPEFFVAGDIRSNENVVLTSLHTLFVREHNRLAARIRARVPGASDETVFQLARKIVGAELQIITYEEFLPALLGPFAPSTNSWYRRQVDPSIATEFSAALFRVGHTLLSPNLVLGESGQTLPLRDAFSDPALIVNDPHTIDRLLLGLSRQRAQEIDSFVIDDVRNFLFLPPPFAIGLDLPAINMQRARDHGVPPYNAVRRAYGLPRARNFRQITRNPAVQQSLLEAYGSVDDVDLWVGAISEDHIPLGNVGPLIGMALLDQFIRLRDGDRFFYSRDPDIRLALVRQVIDLDRVTLGKIIRWNTNATTPNHVFFVQD